MSQVLPSDRYPSAEPSLFAEDAYSDSENGIYTGLRIGIPIALVLWAILFGIGYLVWLVV